MNADTHIPSRDRVVQVSSGWLMLPLNILFLLGSIALFIYPVVQGRHWSPHTVGIVITLAVLTFVWSIIMFSGFFSLQPNEARVLILFGEYRGTVRSSGFYWGNPFYSRGPASNMTWAERVQAQSNKSGTAAPVEHKSLRGYKMSLRTRNFNSDRLKVNDKRGNPIEIAAVVVWKVQDAAQAVFDVDDFENYVRVQSESGLRHLASAYAYDHGEENEGHIAQRGRRGVAGTFSRTSGAFGESRRAGGGGSINPPGLRSRNRPSHAAPTAGGGSHCRKAEDRAWCCKHGRYGFERIGGKARSASR